MNDRPSDVLLVGYYGQRNFGDDVLMKVAHSIAREWLPGRNIGVLGVREPYVRHLLGDDVDFVPFGGGRRFELILHGGGGTFFDFKRYRAAKKVRNALLLGLGHRAYVATERALRRATGRVRDSASRRIGMGIGVGSYTPGSPRFLAELPIMSEFDALWVRDPQSAHNVERLGVNDAVIEGSDLAFLNRRWMSENSPERSLGRPSEGRPRVGLVLRDWQLSSGRSLASEVLPALDQLRAHYRITLISLNPANDYETLATLKETEAHLYCPDRDGLEGMIEVLAAQNVLVTARAHGAICGACLGVPSVILPIEPKLEAVHAMLPGSSVLAEWPLDPSSLRKAIDVALAISPAAIAGDVQRNREKSQAALLAVRKAVAVV